MDSFHIYLPSNACQHLYPNNTASNYQTQMDQTINLSGEWEVGVESICYSSHIEEKRVKAQIVCEVETTKYYVLNDLNALIQFKVDENIDAHESKGSRKS